MRRAFIVACASMLLGCSTTVVVNNVIGGADAGATGDAAGAGTANDAGPDASTPDATLVPEAGPASGEDGGPADATGVVDAGASDGSTSPSDAAVDASDAGTDGGPAGVDGGPTFENPLQIDVRAIFNANTVVSTADGGIPLTPMDGSGTSDNNDFPTQSEMSALGQSLQYGLPDDAFFPANAPTTPSVQLAWNNASNLTENSLFAPSTLNQVFTFNVPPQPYLQVQVYATGAAGASTLNFTLTYADGSTSSSLTLPDWCDQSQPAGGEFFFAAVYRVENGNTAGVTVLTTPVCRIYALNLNPDHGRTLVSVSFKDQVLSTNSTANLVFYGATAW